jgi:hypothetical protein
MGEGVRNGRSRKPVDLMLPVVAPISTDGI